MARRAAAKAAKKKKKRDRQKRKKRAIEDTDHVEGEDIKFEPAKFLAESRTSSASSSGSSSFESVQEEEPVRRCDRVRGVRGFSPNKDFS